MALSCKRGNDVIRIFSRMQLVDTSVQLAVTPKSGDTEARDTSLLALGLCETRLATMLLEIIA